MHSIDFANGMLARMDSSDTLYCDIETTGLNCKGGEDHAVGLAIADEHGQAIYLPFQHEADAHNNMPIEYLHQVVVPFLNKQRRTLVWHNLKFDYQAWRTWGIDVWDWSCKWADSEIEMYLLNEEYPSYKLDFLGKRFLKHGKVDAVGKFADAFGWRAVTPTMMDEYARNDVAGLTRPLHHLFREELRKRDNYDLGLLKARFAMHLAKLEIEGVGVNEDFCTHMADRGEHVMKLIRARLGFNPGSSDELGKYLIEHLQLPVLKRGKPHKKTGIAKPSFDKEVMAKYEEMLEGVNDETARLVLDYRGWQKAVSSLYLPMLRKRDKDGRVRTEFRQTRTRTGRLASANPNLQQIPRWTVKEWNGQAKRSFHSGSDDFELVGYDYSQLELRLAAAYGQDRKLIEVFENDGDPFAVFAESLFGEFNEETRFKAKNHFIYPMNYGAGRAKIAGMLGTDMEGVKKYYDAYQSEHPGIYTAAKECERRAEERGYIKYWTGRRRHCRFKEHAYKMWNSAMQGGAAELVERAMLRAPNDENCRQVLQVHDEIVFAVRKGMRDKYEPEIIHAMTDWPFGVKLKVEGKIWTEQN